MVADPLTQTRPKKPQGFQSRIPLPQKLQVRALYLIQQLSTKEIAEKASLSENQVRNLIHREKWLPSKLRLKASLQAKADARIQAESKEVVDSVAVQTADLSIGTLAKSRLTLDRNDPNAARDLQAYSQAAKNFVGIYRQARELDQQVQEGKLGSVVVFLGDLPRVSARPDPINVTPALPSPSPKEAPISSGAIEDTGSGVAQP